MEKYDLIIIGGGGAGFAAATVASSLGAHTAIVNAGLPLGGTCANVGCVPCRLLGEIASTFHNMKKSRFAAIKNASDPTIDLAAAIRTKDEVVAALGERSYRRLAEELSIAVIEGKASFVSSERIEVAGGILEAEKFIIATGSRPQVLPFDGLDRVHFLTSREALTLKQLPRSMTIIGGGPAGLEFAQLYTRFGTRVTVLEKERQILPLTEKEVASELRRSLAEEGIEIHTGVSVERLREVDGLKIVEAVEIEESTLGLHTITVSAEELLLTTGVIPNSQDIGLEAAGVTVDSRGFIKVNGGLHTSAGNVWAAGDVVGRGFLETMATREGYVAASNALRGNNSAIDYQLVPRVVFTEPQFASFGLTETESRRRYGGAKCRTLKVSQLPGARATGEVHGLVKMIVHPEKMTILGVHMVASGAADIIHEAALAVKFKLTTRDIVDTMHAFPTTSEAIKLVAQSFHQEISQWSCCVDPPDIGWG